MIRFYLFCATFLQSSLNSSLSVTNTNPPPPRSLPQTILMRLRGGSDWESFQHQLEEENELRYWFMLMSFLCFKAQYQSNFTDATLVAVSQFLLKS
jgi:hypothetical protein